MSAKANYFKLGLFILIAFTIGIGAVVVLGASRLFKPQHIIETYLNQSVQGIEVGSKVKYRGVSIGSVRRVGFTRNHYSRAETRPIQHSYVLLEIEITSMPFTKESAEEIKRNLPQEVEHGLRARITSQGVTGTSYIELDYLDSARFPPLPIDWEPEHPYIPSAPSALSRIVSSAEDLFASLERIDFTKIAADVEHLILSLDKKVDELPISMLGSNAVALVAELRDSNQQLQKLLRRPELHAIIQDASSAVAGLRRAAESPGLTNSVDQLHHTLRRLDQLVAAKDNNLEVTLDNLRVLTENLKELSENAKRFPAHVLFGEPPRPSRNSP